MTAPKVIVRTTREEDFPQIIALCERVYPGSAPWKPEQLAEHRRVFPEGQFVAVTDDGRVVGFAASLIIRWRAYRIGGSWRDFTDRGYFANHDPRGRTLYGAEVMVDPEVRQQGIGKKLYKARRELVERLGLKRIRAGARLRGYHRYADQMNAVTYAQKVVRGEISDPTLSFQLGQGFDVIAVVPSYLGHDPESLGWAAVIEWLNPAMITETDRIIRDPRFARAHR